MSTGRLPDTRLMELASDSMGQAASARAWFLQQGESGLELLLQGLDDRRLGSTAHARILRILETLALEEAVPAIRKALRRAIGRSDPIVREAAMTALASLHTPDAVGDLIALLDDPDSDVVRRAAVLVGETGAVEGLQPMERLLADTDPSIRYSAVEGLLRSGDPRAQVALERRLTVESDADVRNRILAGTGNERGGS